MRVKLLLLGVALALGTAACGAGPQHYIPVDSKIKPWTPPDNLAAEAPASAPAAAHK